MSEKFIPEHVDPFRFAEQSLALDGIVKINDMHRLRNNLNSTDENQGKVQVNLKFGIDEQKITFIKGHLEAQLTLQCQRCLDPFSHAIKTDFCLGIVNSLDEANTLPECYEPALTKDGTMALRELIEDEIILNLPIIPRHDPGICKVKLPLKDSDWEKNHAKNPFYVLEALKHKEK